MKLKNVLILAFLVLTLIPVVIVSCLLYKSGFNLAKESYMRNLVESINVQADYISQTIENNMIIDYRFASKSYVLSSDTSRSAEEKKSDIIAAFQSYLETSEDKITVCILMDKDRVPIYTIGEKKTLNKIDAQLSELSQLDEQKIMEFDLGNGVYSLGIVTPIKDERQAYAGSLISVYDKSYLFKIISSYYEIADASTYIFRQSGDIVNYRGLSEEKQNASIERALNDLAFTSEGAIEMHTENNMTESGYYKNIRNTPWSLVGFIDLAQINEFTNKYIWVYIIIIAGIFIVDMVLSVYFSRKVVAPINGLIQVMDGYPDSLNSTDLDYQRKNSYFETRYLREKFFSLMNKILLVQHNFEGVYQLYQSGAINDTNIDIDVENQTINTNKRALQDIMDQLDISEEACVVERFTNCFCKKDQVMLMAMLETMRDKHLSVTREAEVFTPYLGERWFHILVVPMYEDERLSRLFVQLRDISSFKKQELESIEQAKREPLTGLYNRAGFAGGVNHVMQESDNAALHGLLFLDMNSFKLVNDNLGHSAGDELLRVVSRVLLEVVAPNDLVARFGGDEFALFLPNTSIEEIEAVKEELNRRLVFPFHTERVAFTVSASIGVSTWSQASPDPLDKLLEKADAVMYQTKRKFKQNEQKET